MLGGARKAWLSRQWSEEPLSMPLAAFRIDPSL
jgi:hypothetical protein